MARQSPVEAVLTAIVTTLKNTSAVTALATGGIYNHVPQNTSYPYIEVCSPTGRRMDTMTKFGTLTLVDVKAVSQYHGDLEAARIISEVNALHLQKPSATGHTILGIAHDGEERMSEVVNGIVTRTHVSTFRVWSEQN